MMNLDVMHHSDSVLNHILSSEVLAWMVVFPRSTFFISPMFAVTFGKV